MIFCMSAFLDNIAGAVIGGIVARRTYQGRVGIGFVASIVAAANAGGAGSVIGDTTTTMMWLGVSRRLRYFRRSSALSELSQSSA